MCVQDYCEELEYLVIFEISWVFLLLLDTGALMISTSSPAASTPTTEPSGTCPSTASRTRVWRTLARGCVLDTSGHSGICLRTHTIPLQPRWSPSSPVSSWSYQPSVSSSPPSPPSTLLRRNISLRLLKLCLWAGSPSSTSYGLWQLPGNGCKATGMLISQLY